jgi:hypothetical protein
LRPANGGNVPAADKTVADEGQSQGRCHERAFQTPFPRRG